MVSESQNFSLIIVFTLFSSLHWAVLMQHVPSVRLLFCFLLSIAMLCSSIFAIHYQLRLYLSLLLLLVTTANILDCDVVICYCYNSSKVLSTTSIAAAIASCYIICYIYYLLMSLLWIFDAFIASSATIIACYGDVYTYFPWCFSHCV